MLIPTNLQKYNNIQFYFTSFIVLVCLYFTFAFLFDLFQIHIYRHDAVYYYDSYFGKLKKEGRWINYLLFSTYSLIPGKLASFLNLLFVYLFVLIVCYRWTKKLFYSLLVALLFIQIPTITSLLMWPVTPLASYFILFLATLVSPYIPIYLFYPLFGILFFGTMSNLYYLLPLVHLSLLINDSIKQNIKVLFIKIILPWALGFIIGYIFMLLILYILTGQYELEIADWRQPNHIENIQDIRENVLKSFNFLQHHVTIIFANIWQNIAMIIALLVGIIGIRKEQYIPMVILSLAIIIAHYVIVIPIGIHISFRTIIATYFGFLVLFFLHPAIKKWQYNLLLPIIMFMIFSFYQINHNSLKWYASITNLYYNELLRVVPLPPKLYNGLAFLSSSDEVKKINTIIQDKFDLKKGRMEHLDHDFRWRPVGFEAGFKVVLLCRSWHQNNSICKEISKSISSGILIQPKTSGLYQILGQQDGFLIISLNATLDLESNVNFSKDSQVKQEQKTQTAENITKKEVVAPIKNPIKSAYTKTRLEHLNTMKGALQQYYEKYKAYPANLRNGLVPEFLEVLPKEPFYTSDPIKQYSYNSDGKEYKLITYQPEDCEFIAATKPELMDVKRKCAYGYWTEGAVNW